MPFHPLHISRACEIYWNRTLSLLQKYIFFILFNFLHIRILVGKPEGNRSQGRPRRGWVNDIIMDLRERGWDSMDWIGLAQDREQ
jgi:hypothetical protein